MRREIAIMGAIFILFTSTASAYNPYGDVYEYNLYFDGKLLNTTEVPKPVLKIGEPFDVKIDFMVYKKCEMSVKLSEIENGYFIILNGSTPKMDVYRADVLEKNSTITYEWTVKPTDKWKGGSLPIDLVYQIDDFETKNSLVHGSFTIAYPYISNEYYEGETLTPEEQPVSETESSPTSASAPAFKLAGAISVLALVFALLRR
ncbi:sarcinarray family MAST domain-containing protein [Methanosarcina sp.]|jgi:MAST domain-containing protein|uniref:sarcinarray family MAST domain-containing protein n=1 Tax=Methanosarcina sp. TaxID=2213 RepID=UPI002C2E9649|nr:sarcinarray family MAST domain-containing protein [Methanosarcina sp.]HOW16029.1 sarcinarray family MAST domain-containing protein [Methanosarcina sp.]